MVLLLRRRGVGRFLLSWFAASLAAAAAAATDTRARIEFLTAEIARHDELYFRKAQPEISDFDYDALKRELEDLRARFPELANLAGGDAQVGDDRVEGFAKRRHLGPMLSLAKVYSEAELTRWHEAVMEKTAHARSPLVLEPKFDGLAISATYVDGRLAQVVTRGNGEEGDDVTENAIRFCRIPSTLDASRWPVPKRMEVRGEVFVSFAEFRRVNRVRSERGEPAFASPRNLAAGTLKRIDIGETEARKLDVVFFASGGAESPAEIATSQRELTERLRAWGLPAPEISGVAESLEAALGILREWERARADWAYPVDGVVLKVDAFAARRELGESTDAPRWAVAFKFAPQRATTRLLGITIQVGRSGVLTPVAELEPVAVGGATVARASLHNADEIARRDVRVGDTVYVERAGEIIPAIVGVDRARRPATAEPFRFPENCPACGAVVEADASAVARRCPNLACPAQLKRRLAHFAAAAVVGIKGLGPATVDALVDAGKVRGIADLYTLKTADVAACTRLREKSAEALILAIDASRRAERWRVLHGIGLPGVGPASAKSLATRFGDLKALAAATETELAETSRLGSVSAAVLAAHLRQPEVQKELAGLAEIFGQQP